MSTITEALQLGKRCQLVAESKGFYLALANDGDNGDQHPWWQVEHKHLNFRSKAHEREETAWIATCIDHKILVSNIETMKSAFSSLKETEEY